MEYIKHINNLIINEKIVGINTCIICNGKRDSLSFGYKSIVPCKELNNNDTLYDVASLTKVLTILPIICKLIDNKEISFDTKVHDILPEFKYIVKLCTQNPFNILYETLLLLTIVNPPVSYFNYIIF